MEYKLLSCPHVLLGQVLHQHHSEQASFSNLLRHSVGWWAALGKVANTGTSSAVLTREIGR